MQEQTIQVVFPLSQEVFVLPMVVSTILETPLPSGGLPKSTPIAPGPVVWITTVSMCPGKAIKNRVVPLSAASRINYLSISLFSGLANAGGRKNLRVKLISILIG